MPSDTRITLRELEALRRALCHWRELQWRKLPAFAESTSARHRELLSRHLTVVRDYQVAVGLCVAGSPKPVGLTEGRLTGLDGL